MSEGDFEVAMEIVDEAVIVGGEEGPTGHAH